MASSPAPLKLYQIEEPDGAPEAGDGIGLAVGIALSRAAGAAVAVAVGGNAEQIVPPERPLAGEMTEGELAALLRDLRAAAERAVARPVSHAVIALGGFDFADAMVLRAAAAADIAVMGVRRDGDALAAAIEAEDLAGLLSN